MLPDPAPLISEDPEWAAGINGSCVIARLTRSRVCVNRRVIEVVAHAATLEEIFVACHVEHSVEESDLEPNVAPERVSCDERIPPLACFGKKHGVWRRWS